MMNEKKAKLTLTGAIVILSISILFSSYLIANAIRESSESKINSETYEYEFNRFNSNIEKLIEVLTEEKTR